MHTVSETELDGVASLSSSIHQTFVGMSFGAFFTLAITLYTVKIDDPKVYAAFVACAVLFGVLTLYFGIRAAADYIKAKKSLHKIKSGRS